MKLTEFFNRPLDINQHKKETEQDSRLADDVFYHMIDDDRLYKECFFPIAEKIQKLKECGDTEILEMFMPMVIKGCKQFFNKHELEGRMSKKFPLEMREALCHRLYDHYFEDVKKGVYKLG